MLVLGAWRSSLDRWYTPLDAAGNSFGPQFEHQVSDWLAASPGAAAQLLVIADRDCPCTRATLAKLDQAVAQSGRKDFRVVVRDIHDTNDDPSWRRILQAVPATPTLLAIASRRLIYAGPVTSGNFCTTAVGRVLGVSALQVPRATALFDVVDKGCYCRLTKP